MTKSRRGQPTGVATPQQLKLAHNRSFNESVNQPNKLIRNCDLLPCRWFNSQEHSISHQAKDKAMPVFPSTLPRKSRERGAKAYLRRERLISKPSSKVESHPQDCSAGNQDKPKIVNKWRRQDKARKDLQGVEEITQRKYDTLWYMADGKRKTNLWAERNSMTSRTWSGSP